MSVTLGTNELKLMFFIMGVLFSSLGALIGWMEVRLRHSLRKDSGILKSSVFSRETRCFIPVVEATWNDRTVSIEAAPVPYSFLNENTGKVVTIWIGNKEGKLSGLPKCFIETGKPGALPGIRRVLLYILMFSAGGIGFMIASLLLK